MLLDIDKACFPWTVVQQYNNITLAIADADRADGHLAVHHRERHVHLLAPDGQEEGLQLLLVHPPALRPPLHIQPPARAGQESTLQMSQCF